MLCLVALFGHVTMALPSASASAPVYPPPPTYPERHPYHPHPAPYHPEPHHPEPYHPEPYHPKPYHPQPHYKEEVSSILLIVPSVRSQ